MPKKKQDSASTKKVQLRLRVFAGPNGSGKSTVIDQVRKIRVDGRPIDLGYYINADNINSELLESSFHFDKFDIHTTSKEFSEIALTSGLINEVYTETVFRRSFSLRNNILILTNQEFSERLAQVTADFLRKRLLIERKKFSFETVFSHTSKLDIMRAAVDSGYKVYLYFVSTESPKINKFRVEARKKKGGHDVPPDKIDSRYFKSLDLLYEACQLAYQVFFFDNSEEGIDSVLFAHYKMVKGKKKWDAINKKEVPQWFKKYYSAKVGGIEQDSRD